MNPRIRIHAILTTLGAAAALGATAARASSETHTPAPDPAVAHTMFMGLELAVPHQGRSARILDVSDNEIVVAEGDSAVRIPTKGRNIRIQIDHALKLSEGSATVEKLSATRSYTPKSDPYLKFANAAGSAGALEGDVGIASAGLRGAEMAYAAATGVINSGADAPGAAAAQATAAAAIDRAYVDIASTSQNAFSAQHQTSTYAIKLQEELAEENFDAVDVEFTVSSPVPLSTPFVVVLLKYREREQRPEETRTWVISKALAPLDQQPRRVRFQQGGLPIGYILEDYQVHLFNKGQEIATNVAPMRTLLTPEEAFQYRVVDYVSSHPNATLPAAPAAGQVSDALREHLIAKYAGHAVYVRVLPTGRADRAFSDKACKEPIDDAQLDALLSQVRFDPALEKGKPVRGLVMLVGKGSA